MRQRTHVVNRSARHKGADIDNIPSVGEAVVIGANHGIRVAHIFIHLGEHIVSLCAVESKLGDIIAVLDNTGNSRRRHKRRGAFILTHRAVSVICVVYNRVAVKVAGGVLANIIEHVYSPLAFVNALVSISEVEVGVQPFIEQHAPCSVIIGYVDISERKIALAADRKLIYGGFIPVAV